MVRPTSHVNTGRIKPAGQRADHEAGKQCAQNAQHGAWPL
jgi:hypothetical protein